MKRILFVLIFVFGLSAAVVAQERAVGVRIGAFGTDVSYEQNIKYHQFIEANLGVDYGFISDRQYHKPSPGFKVAATYNFVWATPAWTRKGTWALYAGPGLAMGYVEDMFGYKIGEDMLRFYNNGFMLSLVAQVGLSYCFDFPLQLSIDIRPLFGFHVPSRDFLEPGGESLKRHDDVKAGFYESGLFGFIPTIGVRYCF
ncbi:MAG: hypothetical protein ACI3ZQ_01450 [Candidatus Cryptobacteroides sp.]